MAVSMIPNMWHSGRSCKWPSWVTKFGSFTLNQLVVLLSAILTRISENVHWCKAWASTLITHKYSQKEENDQRSFYRSISTPQRNRHLYIPSNGIHGGWIDRWVCRECRRSYNHRMHDGWIDRIDGRVCWMPLTTKNDNRIYLECTCSNITSRMCKHIRAAWSCCSTYVCTTSTRYCCTAVVRTYALHVCCCVRR